MGATLPAGIDFASGAVGGGLDFVNTQATNAFNLFKGLAGALGFSGSAEPYIQEMLGGARRVGDALTTRAGQTTDYLRSSWDRYFGSQDQPGQGLGRVSLTSAGGKLGGRAGIGQQVADYALGSGPGTLGANQQMALDRVEKGITKAAESFKTNIGNFLTGTANAAYDTILDAELNNETQKINGLTSAQAIAENRTTRQVVSSRVASEAAQLKLASSSKLADIYTSGAALSADIDKTFESIRAQTTVAGASLTSEGLESDRSFKNTLMVQNQELNKMWADMEDTADIRSWSFMADALAAAINKEYNVSSLFLGGTGQFQKSDMGAIVAQGGFNAANTITTYQNQPEEPDGWFS